MWISLLVLSLLIQQNVISSEQVIENHREVRQSPECCPCPDPKQDVDPDQDTANSHTIPISADDSCPCRLASDSEPASSFISPAFRKMEQYRPLSSNKEDPKPLLKPEVGLASSVLETLKEVTDQEYQEAVARDAARSALKFIEPLENESRNSMNIILSPNAERNEDIISDASYFQETSYEPPLLSNSFEQLGSQSPINMLGKIFSTPKLNRKTILHKNNFDMDEGASNIQSNILKPVKNSILDQIKLKADVLKLKLFPKIEKGMKNQAFKDFGQVNTSTNSLLKQMKHIVKNPEYTDPTILNSEKNNLSDQLLSPSWHALFNVTDPIKLQTVNKNPKVNLKNIIDTRNKQPNLKNNLSDNTVRISKFSDEDLVENTVCIKNTENPTIFQTYNNDMKNLDDQTKISEAKNIDTVIDTIDNLEQKELSETFNNQIQNTNTDNNLNSIKKKITTSYVEVTTARVIVEKQNRDSHNLKCLDSINDSEFESSNINNQNVNFRNNPNKKLTSSAENTNEIKNALASNSEYQINNELLSSSYEDTNKTDLEVIKLPNIKNDILRTLENFKIANEKIQEKLKSNVQDALRAVVEKTESAGKRVSFANQTNSDYKPYIKNENNVNIQDLQKLSDSLLKQSLLKENRQNVESSESFNDTEKPFDGVNMVPLLSVSNTSNNSKNFKINSSNQQSNPNLIDIAKKEENYCALCSNEIVPNISDTTNMDNDIDEMTAQSSNSVLNTIAKLRLSPSGLDSLSKDRIVQPDVANMDIPLKMDDIKDLLVNYKTSSANNFKDDRNVDLRYLLNADKNIESQNFNKGSSSILNPTSTLNSYKTKVATPKSLNLNSLHSSLEKAPDVLSSPSQNFPANILRYPSENFITKILRNNPQNELNPYFKIPHGKLFTDNFSSIIPSISENIKSRTNNAIKSFRESLDASVNKPNIINKSNIFGKSPLNSENLLDTVLKTRKNINDKMQVLKSKMPFDNVGLNPNRLSIFETSAELYKPLEKKPANLRNSLHNLRRMESFKKKPVLLSLTPDKSTDIMPEISKPSLRSNIKKKLESLTNELSSNSNIGSTGINRPKSYQTKTAIANRSKLKPLKENKIIIRPDPIKSNKSPTLQMNQLKSRIPNLPKLPRKPSIKSNLESYEPKVLANNDFKSKIPYSDLNLKGQKIGNNPYSVDEFAVPQSIKNNKNILKAKQKTLVLPKLKNALPAKNSNQDTNQLTRTEKNVDGTLSASNNIDLFSTAAEPLKENTSYKCKMVCIKDILEVT